MSRQMEKKYIIMLAIVGFIIYTGLHGYQATEDYKAQQEVERGRE